MRRGGLALTASDRGNAGRPRELTFGIVGQRRRRHGNGRVRSTPGSCAGSGADSGCSGSSPSSSSSSSPNSSS